MSTKDFIVHPNRDAIGPDLPGQNGHYRVLAPPPEPMPEDTCRARVFLPPGISHAAMASDGSVTLAGPDWQFVAGVARVLARGCSMPNLLPPFGFRKRGVWHWWDGTTTDYSILEDPDAIEHVRRYLTKQFPGSTIELVDLR